MSTSESKWHVLQRCLAIVQRLQRGAVDRIDLMQAVRELVVNPYGDGNADAQRKRFERDIENLREQLHVKIECPAPDYKYRLTDPGPFAGIGLSSEGLYGLAFLRNTFSAESGATEVVQSFLDGILNMLPSDQQRELTRFNSTLEVNLQRLDAGEIAAIVWEKVRTAVRKRQLLRFHYISGHDEEQLPRPHTVEPYIFRFFRGHYELKAYRRYGASAYTGEDKKIGWFRYRLDRIQTNGIEILPEKLPPGQRALRLVNVRYRLSPTLARRGVSRYFEEMSVSQPDQHGWVEVVGKTDDLFDAQRTFLAYGEHCIVLEPTELAGKMRRSVEELAKLYQIYSGV